MRIRSKISILMVLLCLSTPVRAGEVMVFAAASLTDALQAIGKTYELSCNDKIHFNFAGSNTLARQIEEGAPADIFISADSAKMDRLEKLGLIDKPSRRNLLSNSLVAIVGVESSLQGDSLHALASPQIHRLALADPLAVPAGIYAKAFLIHANLWEAIKDRVITTDNVRATLAAVEAGNADMGIVYKTDAAISKDTRILFEVPPADTSEIVYPIALIKNTPTRTNPEAFYQFLQSDTAREVFKKYGFLVNF